MNSKKIFVDNLKYLINRKNISRSMFARNVGVDYSNVVDWLTGRQYPGTDSMERIAEYFKVDRSALVQPRKPTSSEILSHNLYKLLHRRGITRPKVADDLNLSYNTVVNWFSGRAYPGIHNMDRLARYFNVSKAKLMELPMTYGSRLREIRKRQHIGIDPLADKTGISGSNISRIEQNKIRPKVSTLVKLAEGLGISRDYIFQIAGIIPKRIDLYNILKYKDVSYRGHPLDQDDYHMFKLWFKNKYNI